MSAPYYEDDSVTLWHGRCEDVLPTLDLDGSVHLLTDPPYFKVKADDWDNQWNKSAEFLDWMGSWLDIASPLLSADASVWVFASPELTSAVESVVAQRFRVLNSVRWIKEGGVTTNKSVPAALRQFLSQWEGIVFAESAPRAHGTASEILHRRVFAPIGDYIRGERERAGLSRRDVAARLGGYKNEDSANANIFNWELGKNLISERDYLAIREVLKPPHLARTYGQLAAEYEDLRRLFEALRRPFNLRGRQGWNDLFRFPTVPSYPGKHPCEKPLGLLTHMIETTTRPGDTILDPFAGSGAVLDAARSLGRKAVGIEMDEHWCKQIAGRLSQDVLDFGGAA